MPNRQLCVWTVSVHACEDYRAGASNIGADVAVQSTVTAAWQVKRKKKKAVGDGEDLSQRRETTVDGTMT